MKKLIYILAVTLAMTGCIHNDLPYPVVVPHITSLEAEGAEEVSIDYDNRIVSLTFPETKDLRSVSILSFTIDQDVAVPSIELVGVHDLTSPLKFDIRTYDDYSWTITGVRNVERYFTVEGQLGSSVIDPANRRAIAMVGKEADITDINVTSLKLGPAGLSTYSLDYVQMKDFTHGITVDVTAFDVTETWELFVEVTETVVEIADVNPWARSAYVTYIAEAGKANGLKYRHGGSSEWLEVNREDIATDGGTFKAHIKGLDPDSVYETMAYSGEDQSPVVEFVTESATPIPNGSFEYASKVAGKDFYKFYDPSCGVQDGMYMFWGSGNGEDSEGVNGSASMGIVITYIDTDDKVDGNQSVRAQTSQLAGMLAAGNLFTGQFAGLVGNILHREIDYAGSKAQMYLLIDGICIRWLAHCKLSHGSGYSEDVIPEDSHSSVIVKSDICPMEYACTHCTGYGIEIIDRHAEIAEKISCRRVYHSIHIGVLESDSDSTVICI